MYTENLYKQNISLNFLELPAYYLAIYLKAYYSVTIIKTIGNYSETKSIVDMTIGTFSIIQSCIYIGS